MQWRLFFWLSGLICAMAARLIAVSEVRNGQLGESSGLSRKFDPNDPCTYSTVRKYKCSLHGDQSAGPPVQKCEKTEQLLRKCPGRSVFVLSSILTISPESSVGDPHSEFMWSTCTTMWFDIFNMKVLHRLLLWTYKIIRCSRGWRKDAWEDCGYSNPIA